MKLIFDEVKLIPDVVNQDSIISNRIRFLSDIL